MATDFQRYDDVAIGDIMPPDPIRFEAKAEVVDAFLKATGNDDPRYRDGDAVRRVPSMLASFYLIDLLNARRSRPVAYTRSRPCDFIVRLQSARLCTCRRASLKNIPARSALT